MGLNGLGFLRAPVPRAVPPTLAHPSVAAVRGAGEEIGHVRNRLVEVVPQVAETGCCHPVLASEPHGPDGGVTEVRARVGSLGLHLEAGEIPGVPTLPRDGEGGLGHRDTLPVSHIALHLAQTEVALSILMDSGVTSTLRSHHTVRPQRASLSAPPPSMRPLGPRSRMCHGARLAAVTGSQKNQRGSSCGGVLRNLTTVPLWRVPLPSRPLRWSPQRP